MEKEPMSNNVNCVNALELFVIYVYCVHSDIFMSDFDILTFTLLHMEDTKPY